MEGEATVVAGVRAAIVAASKPRDHFVTKLGVVMAILGSAVGLGNIWKFPYLTGSNGGQFSFLFTWWQPCSSVFRSWSLN